MYRGTETLFEKKNVSTAVAPQEPGVGSINTQDTETCDTKNAMKTIKISDGLCDLCRRILKKWDDEGPEK